VLHGIMGCSPLIWNRGFALTSTNACWLLKNGVRRLILLYVLEVCFLKVWIRHLCNIMVGSMTGFGASRAWTGALVEAIVVSGISVGVWSGLTTLTWVRPIWLAFGYVLLWMMGLYEQACSCCLSFRPQPLTSSCEMR
jgi:hypothetical protein